MSAPHSNQVTAAEVLVYTRQRLADSHLLAMLGQTAASQDVAEAVNVELVHRRPEQLAAMLDILRHSISLGYQLDTIGEHLTTVASSALPRLPKRTLAGAIVCLLDQQARRDARRTFVPTADELAPLLAGEVCEDPDAHERLYRRWVHEWNRGQSLPLQPDTCGHCGRPLPLDEPYDQERQRL